MTNKGRISILIVDEQPIVRRAVSRYFTSQVFVENVYEADKISDAANLLNLCDPNVIIIDICLFEKIDCQAAKEFAKNNLYRTVAFTADDSWDCVQSFIDSGGMGFVSKRSQIEELLQAVISVANGNKWVSPDLQKKYDNNGLSKREKEVVKMVALGYSSKAIAEKLCVNSKTVETHRHNIYKKLGIHKQSQLVIYAIENGLLQKSKPAFSESN
ncbi:MAG: response regulator transcription factor [Armatimonadota bacterium]